DAAARLMARRGFTSVRLEDIAAEVGISGPAVYRHFSAKNEVLDELLLAISERLQAGGRSVVAEGGTPLQVLGNLVEFHIDVLVTKPDLIAIQDRDLASLTPGAHHRVRLLQRQYVEIWVRVITAATVDNGGVALSDDEARVRAHATFGLLNSSPRLPDFGVERLRSLLTAMALAALLVDID
ncbi:MAG: TetR/AcrR family transcriptional regulator, partial [Gordonia sp. (in: high G+C Gram-positive bacteria)]|uniref:TetR/AcrR family transcriptional regulator n=1 Tax=Gordonia sp. (in: high G+C Gram-positive bacteria) TaxID=84139 RepID=UPI003BB80AF8